MASDSNPLSDIQTDSYSPTNPLAHLTQDQIALLTQTFKRLDLNNDGVVDEAEIMNMLTATFPTADASLLDEVRTIIFDTADRNKDGYIDLNEFLQSIATGQGVLPTEVEEVDAQVNSILNHLSTEEIDMFRDAFIKIDRNGDGFVDREELLAAVKPVVGGRYEALKVYLDKIYDVADKDLDGKLNLTEFLASFAEGPGVVPHEVVMDSVQSIRVRLSDEEIAALQDSFIQIDANQDGFIDPEELKQALQKLMKRKFPDFTEATYNEMVSTAIRAADKDQDGKLNLAEFIRSFQEDQGVLPHVFSESRVKRVTHRLTDDEVEQLKEAFSVLDINHDGYIDVCEMDAALRGVLAKVTSDSSQVDDLIELIMAAGDRDNDGKISLSDFITSMASGSKAMEVPMMVAEDRIKKAMDELNDLIVEEDVRKLANVFNVLDRNKDGFLDRSELQDIMEALIRERYPEWDTDYVNRVINAVICGADANQDGRLSLEEFIRSFFEGHGVLPEEFVADVAQAIDDATAEAAAQAEGAEEEATGEQSGAEQNGGAIAQDEIQVPAENAPAARAAPQSAPPTRGGPPVSQLAGHDIVKASTPHESVPEVTPKKLPKAPPPPPADISPTRVNTSQLYFPNDVTGVAVTHDQLWELFNAFDADQSGYLNRNEFKKIYRTLENFGLPPSDRQIDALFSKYSLGEEKLTFDEFAILMLHRSKM